MIPHSFRVSPALAHRIRAAAEGHGLNVSDLVRRACRYVIRRESLYGITAEGPAENFAGVMCVKLEPWMRERFPGRRLARAVELYLDAQPQPPAADRRLQELDRELAGAIVVGAE